VWQYLSEKILKLEQFRPKKKLTYTKIVDHRKS
jgi:hypothetical protein